MKTLLSINLITWKVAMSNAYLSLGHTKLNFLASSVGRKVKSIVDDFTPE